MESESSKVAIAEGIPPIPAKLLDKVCHWEFVDLPLLLGQKAKDTPSPQDGRVVLFQLLEQVQRCQRQIVDIFTRTKALLVYMASAPATSSREVVGPNSPSLSYLKIWEHPAA